jgi:hypothetical protein
MWLMSLSLLLSLLKVLLSLMLLLTLQELSSLVTFSLSLSLNHRIIQIRIHRELRNLAT